MKDSRKKFQNLSWNFLVIFNQKTQNAKVQIPKIFKSSSEAPSSQKYKETSKEIQQSVPRPTSISRMKRLNSMSK